MLTAAFKEKNQSKILKLSAEIGRHIAGAHVPLHASSNHNGELTVRQYSSSYARSYNTVSKGMVERRMRQSVYAVPSFWYTAWVNAGQPDLKNLSGKAFTAEDLASFESLDIQ